MSTPADLAALRLELSPGELVCPKKGQMAKGRCQQLQQEMACTCAVAAAAGCAIGPVPEVVAPRPERRPVIAAAVERRRTAAPAPTTTATATPAAPMPAPVVATAAAATTTAAPAAAKETPMAEADNDKMLAAMQAEPDRTWTREELHEVRGGSSVDATYQALKKLADRGVVARPGRGLYQWAGAKEAPKAKKPAKKATPKPARPAAREEAPEETRAPSKVDKLNWLVDGLEGGFLDQAAFIEQVKALVQ